MPSFSVRCIFRWEPRPNQGRKHLYQERITLWVASDIDEAIALAEQEAREYARDGGDYLGFSQAYELVEGVEKSGVEIFSLLRQSDLLPQEYIDAFFATGEEHEMESL